MLCNLTNCLHLEECATDADGLPCCSDPKFVQSMKDLLEKMRRNSIKLGFYHNARYGRYRSALFYLFRLPSLILSGINGFCAIGLQKFISQTTISLTNAVISFVCGIITSVEISLNLQKRMESELDTYKKFYKLTVEIDKELTLFVNKDDGERTRLREFVEKKYNEYQSIVSLSNIVTSECMLGEDEFERVYRNDKHKNRKILHKIRNDTYQIMPNYNEKSSTQPQQNQDNIEMVIRDEEAQEPEVRSPSPPSQDFRSSLRSLGAIVPFQRSNQRISRQISFEAPQKNCCLQDIIGQISLPECMQTPEDDDLD